MDRTSIYTDVQLKQVLAEETYSSNDWPNQLEYFAASLCCWSDEHEEVDTEALLVSGRLLPYYKFRPGLGSL